MQRNVPNLDYDLSMRFLFTPPAFAMAEITTTMVLWFSLDQKMMNWKVKMRFLENLLDTILT